MVVTHIFETPFDKAPIPAPLPILPTIDNAGPATNVSPPVIAPPIAPPTAPSKALLSNPSKMIQMVHIIFELHSIKLKT